MVTYSNTLRRERHPVTHASLLALPKEDRGGLEDKMSAQALCLDRL